MLTIFTYFYLFLHIFYLFFLYFFLPCSACKCFENTEIQETKRKPAAFGTLSAMLKRARVEAVLCLMFQVADILKFQGVIFFTMEKFLSAVQRFFASMKGHPDYEKIREEQFRNVRAKLAACTFSVEEAARIVDLISKTEWEVRQLQTLKGDVSSRITVCEEETGAASTRPRRQLQNYQNFPLYLTQSLWLAVLGQTSQPQQALALLSCHLGNLGLRNGSEKTYSKVTALMIWKTHGTMSAVMKHQAYQAVKSQMRKHLDYSQSLHPSLPHVLELPDDPSKLNVSWAKVAFANEPRCEPAVDLSLLHLIQQSIPERMGPAAQILPVEMGYGMSSMGNLGQGSVFGHGAATFGQPTRAALPAASQGGGGCLDHINLQIFGDKQQSGNAMPGALPLTDGCVGRQPSSEDLEKRVPMSEKQTSSPENAKALPVDDKKLNDFPQPTPPLKVPEPGKPKADVDAVAASLRAKLAEADAQKEKKLAGLKRPASASAKVSCNKRPATQMKRPASNKMFPKACSVPDRPPDALALYPRGCSKCRWKAGCTPSCYKYRKEWP